MTITVNRLDVYRSIAPDGIACPVGQAIARTLPNSKIVMGTKHVMIDGQRLKLPICICNWISYFESLMSEKEMRSVRLPDAFELAVEDKLELILA